MQLKHNLIMSDIMDNGKLKMENDKNNSQFSTVDSQLPKGWEIKKLGYVC